MDTVPEFLKNKAPKTRRNYLWILKEFFKEMDKQPETYLQNKKTYDYRPDIKNWWEKHLDEVPKTRHTKLGVIKSYLEFYEIVYPKSFWIERRREKKGRRAATLDRVPTQHEFKTLLMHGDVKDKALFLFLATSGMRIDEVLHLKLSMINFKRDPPLITIPGSISKTGDPRITFITQETKGYLEEWIKIRKSYITTAISKTKHLCDKKEEDDKLFPFTYDVAWRGWLRLLKQAGYDDRDSTTGRYIIHIHCLRKFFMSQMKLEVPTVIPEALAGHEEYLDEAYRRFTQEQLGEYYKKAENRLTIMESLPDLSSINQQLEDVVHENIGLKQRVEILEGMINKKGNEALNLLKEKEKKI